MNRRFTDAERVDDVLAQIEQERKSRLLERDFSPDPLTARAIALEFIGRAIVTAAVIGVIVALTLP